jgi:hypothetical protein
VRNKNTDTANSFPTPAKILKTLDSLARTFKPRRSKDDNAYESVDIPMLFTQGPRLKEILPIFAPVFGIGEQMYIVHVDIDRYKYPCDDYYCYYYY